MNYLYATEYHKEGKLVYSEVTAPSRGIAQTIADRNNRDEKVVGVISDVMNIYGDYEYRDPRVDHGETIPGN